MIIIKIWKFILAVISVIFAQNDNLGLRMQDLKFHKIQPIQHQFEPPINSIFS